MKEFEFVGKTVEQAISKGLKELGKKQEDVDIKIISNGGLFKKAKVVISIDDDVTEELNISICKNDVDLKTLDSSFAVDEVVLSKEECDCDDCHCDDDCDCDDECDCDDCECHHEHISPEEYSENIETIEYILDYIEDLAKILNYNLTAEVSETEDSYNVEIGGEDANNLIGYRGDGLSSLQYILNLSVTNKFGKGKRIFLDAIGYKEKREQTLISLADRIARKVEKSKRPYKLEPMKPYERRIIHTHLQNNPNVYTQSTGEEPRRYLTVYPKD